MNFVQPAPILQSGVEGGLWIGRVNRRKKEDTHEREKGKMQGADHFITGVIRVGRVRRWTENRARGASYRLKAW